MGVGEVSPNAVHMLCTPKIFAGTAYQAKFKILPDEKAGNLKRNS